MHDSAVLTDVTGPPKEDAATERLYRSIDGALWSAWCSERSAVTLVRIEATTRRVTSFETTASGPSCHTARLSFGPDGRVWFGVAYAVGWVDPATSRSASFALPRHVAGALPDAVDANAALPGTWVSAIAAGPDGVEVARVNVPFLQHIDAAGRVTTTTTIPPAYAGSADMVRDVNGDLVLAQGYTASSAGVLVIPSRGSAADKPMAQRVGRLKAGRDGELVAATEGGAYSTSTGSLLTAAGARRLVDVVPSAGAWHDRAGNRICADNGTTSWCAPLRSRTGAISGPPDATLSAVTIPETVTDLVVAPTGDVWVVRDGGRTIAVMAAAS